MSYATIAISEKQKDRLLRLAKNAGYNIGKGGDSELPRFIDELLTNYELRFGAEESLLKFSEGGDLWELYIDVLKQDVVRLTPLFVHYGFRLDHVLSEHGQVFIDLTRLEKIEEDKQRREEDERDKLFLKLSKKERAAYLWDTRKYLVGISIYAALGKFLVELIHSFGWYDFEFKSLAVANKVWMHLAVEVYKNVLLDHSGFDVISARVRERNAERGVRIPVAPPYVDFEFWLEQLHNLAIDGGMSEVPYVLRDSINDLVLSVASQNGEALILRAYRYEEDGDYEKAIELYRQAGEVLRAGIPEYVWQEEDSERSAVLYYGSSGSRPWHRSMYALGELLVMLGRLGEAYDVVSELIKLMPDHSSHFNELMCICLVGKAVPDGDEFFKKLLYEEDEFGDRNFVQADIFYWYCRALWLWRIEGETTRSKAAMKKAFEYNEQVPSIIFENRDDIDEFLDESAVYVGDASSGDYEEAMDFLHLAIEGFAKVEGLFDWVIARARATRSMDLL